MKHTPFDNYEAKNGWKLGVEKLKYSQPFGKELMQRELGRFERRRLCNVRAKFSFIHDQPELVKISGKLETGGTVKV